MGETWGERGRIRNGHAPDGEAIRDVWRAVGDDLEEAMVRFGESDFGEQEAAT